MRQITMIEHKDGKLSGEVLEEGKYWQIPAFEYSGNNKEAVQRMEWVKADTVVIT